MRTKVYTIDSIPVLLLDLVGENSHTYFLHFVIKQCKYHMAQTIFNKLCQYVYTRVFD